MKTTVSNLSVDVLIESEPYSVDKSAKEGDVIKHKLKPSEVIIFNDIYHEYGYDKTIKIFVKVEDFEKIHKHIQALREKEYDDKFTEDDLPF